MSDTLTVFKNHKSKLYTIHPDSTRFSIIQCQSITVNNYGNMVDLECEFSEQYGFVRVSEEEFEKKL